MCFEHFFYCYNIKMFEIKFRINQEWNFYLSCKDRKNIFIASSANSFILLRIQVKKTLRNFKNSIFYISQLLYFYNSFVRWQEKSQRRSLSCFKNMILYELLKKLYKMLLLKSHFIRILLFHCLSKQKKFKEGNHRMDALNFPFVAHIIAIHF